MSIWLPFLAELLGAKQPRRVPVWLARFALGEAGVFMMTAVRGSSNAKAKAALRFQPSFATWRDGLRQSLAM